MHANRLHPLATGALVLALACLFGGLTPGSAGAQCEYPRLNSGTPVAVGTSPSFFSFGQPVNYWTVIAVQPPSAADWDLSVWQDTYTYPVCVSNLLAGSSYGGSTVDFVVGDYNFNAYGTRYVQANLYSGTGDATVEWNATDGLLGVNAAAFQVDFAGGTSPFIHVWDVALEAGRTYRFNFYPYGSAASHLLLFSNTGQGTCWKRRADAEFDVTSSTTYVAPVTGYYGLVVVNDNAAGGTVIANVEACTTPIPLVSGVSQSSDLVSNYYSFDQQQNYWTAIGLRCDGSSGLSVYRSAPGDITTGCLADELASSSPFAGMAGVVVGDFNYNTPGTYYVGAWRSISLPPLTGVTQWDDDRDQLTVNGMLTNGTMSSSDVVRAWEVYLYGGTTYRFTFGRSGADLSLLLFRNPAAGEYWAGRSSAVLSTEGDADYTAPSSGLYGVVIVNDDGAAGSYAVGVGTCTTPVALTYDQPWVTPLGENYVSCDMVWAGWEALGVRGSDPGTDWDMVVQGTDAAAFPACRGPDIAVSDLPPPAADFAMVFFPNPYNGIRHAWPHTYYGQGSGTGTVTWTGAYFGLLPNDQLIQCTFQPTGQFLFLRTASLTAGHTYWLRYYGPSTSDGRLMLFRNPSSGEYWVPRSGAVAQTTGGEDTPYTAPATGYYAAVVVDDASEVSDHALFGIGECTPPTALSSGTVAYSLLARTYYSFTESSPYWTAVAARVPAPWNLGAYANPSGGTYPECLSGGLAASEGGSMRAAVLVGDFNHNPYGTYYLYSGIEGGLWYISGAYVDWQAGSQMIGVGDPPVARTTGPDDVLEVWDCWLEPQKDYTFKLSHAGAANLKLLVFRNTGGGTYWAGRDDAQVELTGQATWRTTGTSSEYYGLVVVNDNGESDSYTLQVVDAGASAVDDAPPSATEFGSVRPNPARGDVRLEFALREAADVSFRVLDMAGRVVATLPARACSAGRSAATWDGRGPDGSRLPAGVYLVRMAAGGRVIGTRRVALLD